MRCWVAFMLALQKCQSYWLPFALYSLYALFLGYSSCFMFNCRSCAYELGNQMGRVG